MYCEYIDTKTQFYDLVFDLLIFIFSIEYNFLIHYSVLNQFSEESKFDLTNDHQLDVSTQHTKTEMVDGGMRRPLNLENISNTF